ncbi:MAG: TfoX/Sxy family protein, partial [Eubacterium sp.]|nr:TfoX/Sxy family protein [Eubacterium sp.]
MTDLTSMRNIGKELERKLKLAGINSAEELITIGSKEAYFKLKLRFPEVCSVHLYA